MTPRHRQSGDHNHETFGKKTVANISHYRPGSRAKLHLAPILKAILGKATLFRPILHKPFSIQSG